MINLLPPREKEVLFQEKKYRLVLIFWVLVLIFLISLTLNLFSINSYLKGKLDSAKILVSLEEEKLKRAEFQNLKEKILLANQNLSKLNSFYQSQKDLTRILEEISEVLPPEIYLNDLSWQKIPAPEEKYLSQVSILGFSPSREILIQFKENLKEKKEFREIYFPPATWLKARDIDFYLTFQIVPEL